MKKIIPEPIMAFHLNDISIIPKIEKISVSNPLLSLESNLTRGIRLRYPFVASPMDSVVNFEMAIKMEKYGLLPIFYICEKNQASICNIIEKYLERCGGNFGIATPTSIEFIKHLFTNATFSRSVAIALDTLHSKPYNHLKTIEYLCNHYKNLNIISGNITNEEDCLSVIDCGVDAVRVGMTFNSVNRGYELTGCGRQQATAIYECSHVADRFEIPVIADGGINGVSDMAKCIALGASSVMIGKMFAAMDESPCKTIEKDGIEYKEYVGMSRSDIIDSDMIPEGSSILIKPSGSFEFVLNDWIQRLGIAVVRSGAYNLTEMRKDSVLEYYVNLSRA